jgi:hypothetical protein
MSIPLQEAMTAASENFSERTGTAIESSRNVETCDAVPIITRKPTYTRIRTRALVHGDASSPSLEFAQALSTKPTSKTSSEESPPATTKSRIVLRKKHTLVERKYRKHINDRFDELLKMLPARGEEEHEVNVGGGSERKLKKSKILDFSKAYIGQLEKKVAYLERDHVDLQRERDFYRSAYRRLVNPQPAASVGL